MRLLRGDVGDRFPIGEPIAGAADLHVRGNAEDARAHFLLEAVHHGEHHDQRPHADGDADHRHERVDADETVASPGAQIAQADEKLVSHGSAREYTMDAESHAALARLIRRERIAHLGTLRAGGPLVSMTLYMPASDFSAFYVHVSTLAWHTQDMQHDPRVALSIAETDDQREDPFTLMRVSIRGEAAQMANAAPDFASLNTAWLARFPAQAINFEL